MLDVAPSIEIEKVSGILANFGWKVVKQEITETDVVLTIKKTISPAGEITPPPAD
jgi:hypothetical protein